jgi:hypothetical protein
MSSIWGPTYWEFLHSISILYPTNPSILDKEMLLLLLKSFGDVIPCPICSNHYKENLKSFPVNDKLNSKNEFIKWVIDFHNIVNKMLGKKILSLEEGLIKVDLFEKNNIIHQIDNILKYAIHALPEKIIIQINKKKNFQNFVKSSMYLANLQKNKINFNFNNRTTYQKTHKKFVSTIKI